MRRKKKAGALAEVEWDSFPAGEKVSTFEELANDSRVTERFERNRKETEWTSAYGREEEGERVDSGEKENPKERENKVCVQEV